jgi:hypothetical protein
LASQIPAPQAAANIVMPRCALRRVAIANIKMKMPMAVNCISIPVTFMEREDSSSLQDLQEDKVRDSAPPDERLNAVPCQQQQRPNINSIIDEVSTNRSLALSVDTSIYQ